MNHLFFSIQLNNCNYYTLNMAQSFLSAYLQTNDLSNASRVKKLYQEVNKLKMLNSILINHGYPPCNTTKKAVDACLINRLISEEYYKRCC